MACRAELQDLALIHEGGVVRDPGRMLEIVRDNGDGVIALQLVDGLLDLGRRDRIERSGSSKRITSGPTASVRAMHRRCCCPPDRLSALWAGCPSPRPTGPRAGAPLRRGSSAPPARDRGRGARRGPHCRRWRGERASASGTHADARAQCQKVHVGGQDVLPVHPDLAIDRLVEIKVITCG